VIELRDRAQARAWLAAGLANIRVGEPGVEQLAAEAKTIAEVLTERGSLPPVGAVVDVGRLLGGGSPRSDDTSGAPVALRAALRGYRDQVLARLEASVELEPLVDACAALATDELRRRAVGLVIVRLLRRLNFMTGVAIAPALIREMARAPVDELDEPVAAAELELLADAYTELAAGARRVGRLLEPSDTFLVERIEALGDLAQRLAIAEIGEVEDAIARRLPRRVVGRRRDRDRAVMARMTEDEQYPTGGFSAISTSGALENLVSSELIYMERGVGPGRTDLFDLRWAEGELLYYTRDDSLFFRGRRKIVFALMPDCTRARVKDVGAGHQRLIAALGLLVVVLDRLEAWLDATALEVQWLFVTEPDGAAPLQDEQALAEILCGPWSERGVAAVETASALPAEVDASAATETAALVIGAAPRGPAIDADVSGYLCVGEPRPALSWRHRPDAGAEPAGEVAESWVWCATEILAELV
jgi:hypothetical protein